MSLPVFYTRLSSPVGTLSIFATSKGVNAVCFREEGFRNLRRRIIALRGERPVQDDDMLRDTAGEFEQYFLGRLRQFHAVADLTGLTPFQQKVIKALQRIPYGSVRSYEWVARKIRNPRACRAVGRTCSANPVPLLAPCHRVISKGGSLGGFSAGLGIKQWLLDLESRNA